MDRAYLHFFRLNGDEEMQLLCLHCDPNEPSGHPNSIYKQSPHLHLTMTGSSLDHAHVPLADGFLTHVLASLESLTAAFKRAIAMLSQEILPLI
jgi:hypothetical protein